MIRRLRDFSFSRINPPDFRGFVAWNPNEGGEVITFSEVQGKGLILVELVPDAPGNPGHRSGCYPLAKIPAKRPDQLNALRERLARFADRSFVIRDTPEAREELEWIAEESW
jgi:hypothetical protein